jgi:hypothetical protein
MRELLSVSNPKSSKTSVARNLASHQQGLILFWVCFPFLGLRQIADIAYFLSSDLLSEEAPLGSPAGRRSSSSRCVSLLAPVLVPLEVLPAEVPLPALVLVPVPVPEVVPAPAPVVLEPLPPEAPALVPLPAPLVPEPEPLEPLD